MIFCTVWFLIGHTWAYTDQYNYCSVPIHEMTQAIFILHYIMAVWSFLVLLFDSPTTLKWCQKHIQSHLDHLAEEYLRREKMLNRKSREHTERDASSFV